MVRIQETGVSLVGGMTGVEGGESVVFAGIFLRGGNYLLKENYFENFYRIFLKFLYWMFSFFESIRFFYFEIAMPYAQKASSAFALLITGPGK